MPHVLCALTLWPELWPRPPHRCAADHQQPGRAIELQAAEHRRLGYYQGGMDFNDDFLATARYLCSKNLRCNLSITNISLLGISLVCHSVLVFSTFVRRQKYCTFWKVLLLLVKDWKGLTQNYFCFTDISHRNPYYWRYRADPSCLKY
jgi:hypothetical protein